MSMLEVPGTPLGGKRLEPLLGVEHRAHAMSSWPPSEDLAHLDFHGSK